MGYCGYQTQNVLPSIVSLMRKALTVNVTWMSLCCTDITYLYLITYHITYHTVRS